MNKPTNYTNFQCEDSFKLFPDRTFALTLVCPFGNCGATVTARKTLSSGGTLAMALNLVAMTLALFVSFA